jgi:hypothetical protein
MTRFFTIKVKAVFKHVEGYTTCIREVESKDLDFSVSILKKKELMDGRTTRMEVTAPEARRRAVLRMY